MQNSTRHLIFLLSFLMAFESKGDWSNSLFKLEYRPIGIELTENNISWVQSGDPEFDAYLNQGMAYLHVFHYIDALRSFKMAHEINKESLYPITGMLFSYFHLKRGLNLKRERDTVGGWLSLAEKQKPFASQRELLWLDLVESFLFNKVYVRNSYNQLLAYDPNDTETLTLGTLIYSQTYSPFSEEEMKNIESQYKKVLSIQPKHIGANHYLIHLKEDQRKSPSALQYAKTLAENASWNSHAVHMLGHILPELGKWSLAKSLFQKAHENHLAWAKRNNVSPTEDWHYIHNLYLLGITELGLGEIDSARQTFESFCSIINSDYCFPELQVGNMLIPADILVNIYNQLFKYDSRLSHNYFYWELKKEAELFNKIFDNKEPLSEHLNLTSKIMLSQPGKQNNSLKKSIENYIEKSFPKDGFDSWSSGLINSLRILSATARTGNRELYDVTLKALHKKVPEFDFDLYKHIQNKF